MATRTGSREGRTPPVHPYLDIAIATEFASMQLPLEIARRKKLIPWIPLLVEFDPTAFERKERETPLQAFTRLEWLQGDMKGEVVVAQLFRDPPRDIAASSAFNFCILLVRHPSIERIVRSTGWRTVIIRAEFGPQLLLQRKVQDAESHMTDTLATRGNASELSCQGLPTRVVIGVIDHGIAYANSRFRDASGSRIDWLWQQDMIGIGTSPFPGRELSAAQIDTAVLAAHGDEDVVYQRAGGLDYSVDGYKALGRRRSHGTHVLDLAVNDQFQLGHRAEHPIIAVDMPDDAISDPAGSTLTPHAAWALIYLLARAESIRNPNEVLPIVANISYGPYEGPHDGTALLERFMDFLVGLGSGSLTPLQIVLAAGNSRQARTHAAFRLSPGADITLNWRLQPDSLSPGFMEIWLPTGMDTEVELTLTSPAYPRLTHKLVVNRTDDYSRFPATGNILMSAKYTHAGLPRGSILIYVSPTGHGPESQPSHAIAPSGVWHVHLKNTSQQLLCCDAWIKRSDTPSGRRLHGRQSTFEDPMYNLLDKEGRPQPYEPLPITVPPAPGHRYAVRRDTLSGIATGQNTVVIGASRHSDMAPAGYTSQGGRKHFSRATACPNWLSPSEDSRAHPGRLAAGTRSGSWVIMGGTSAAAPQSTRAIAVAWIGQPTPPLPLPGLVAPRFPPNISATERAEIAGGGIAPSTTRRGRP